MGKAINKARLYFNNSAENYRCEELMSTLSKPFVKYAADFSIRENPLWLANFETSLSLSSPRFPGHINPDYEQ